MLWLMEPKIAAAIRIARRDYKSRPKFVLDEIGSVLADHPENPQLLFYAGACEYLIGHKESAEGFLKKSMAIDPSNSSTMDYLGHLALSRGDLTRARELFSMAQYLNERFQSGLPERVPKHDLNEFSLPTEENFKEWRRRKLLKSKADFLIFYWQRVPKLLQLLVIIVIVPFIGMWLFGTAITVIEFFYWSLERSPWIWPYLGISERSQ